MAVGIGAGASVSIATTYGTQFTISAITNATEAVATLSASHGVAVGDFIEVTSGWAKLNKRVVRIKTVATNDVTLEGINTSSTTDYPAGTGAGTGREITAWTNISNIKADSFSTSGGDQKYASTTALESTIETQMPTTRSPYEVNWAVMDTSSGLTAAENAAAQQALTAIRVVAGASVTVANGYWSVSAFPSISGTEVTTRACSFSSNAEPKMY